MYKHLPNRCVLKSWDWRPYITSKSGQYLLAVSLSGYNMIFLNNSKNKINYNPTTQFENRKLGCELYPSCSGFSVRFWISWDTVILWYGFGSVGVWWAWAVTISEVEINWGMVLDRSSRINLLILVWYVKRDLETNRKRPEHKKKASKERHMGDVGIAHLYSFHIIDI